MTIRGVLRHYARVVRFFVSTRALEVGALQASPIIGGFLGGFSLEQGAVLRMVLLVLGSLALTAHVFVLNDWAGHRSDLRDPRRARLVFTRQGISRGDVARIAMALLIFSNMALAIVGGPAVLLGTAIAVLGLLYSCSPVGKSTPVAASINHLVGGSLHFLLGYTLFHPLDGRGLAISIFFGLVFAAGHLNQEVRDHEGDALNGIRTSAVVFGCQRTFLASLGIFTLAYALIVVLAMLDLLPRLLIWSSAILWSLQVALSAQALRRGLSSETALWMQRRYRLLFAVTGLAMLIR
ncbi:UbiA family prenyltransferase [Roseimicrobium sp. ORNL1]|uniref:UbiA family prenyltransferase n=1 Tax=Roseimicrobium sp. ORNL1 TaxID=2711231 RepID=UPI0013E1FBED|nr:UbiA family prenyltransferase [Roseimicrobium sp. ORNL1]QIF05738.1 UbiA family prenyltransferase [Roseimicrobium sp. ORNL1]